MAMKSLFIMTFIGNDNRRLETEVFLPQPPKLVDRRTGHSTNDNTKLENGCG